MDLSGFLFGFLWYGRTFHQWKPEQPDNGLVKLLIWAGAAIYSRKMVHFFLPKYASLVHKACSTMPYICIASYISGVEVSKVPDLRPLGNISALFNLHTARSWMYLQCTARYCMLLRNVLHALECIWTILHAPTRTPNCTPLHAFASFRQLNAFACSWMYLHSITTRSCTLLIWQKACANSKWRNYGPPTLKIK